MEQLTPTWLESRGLRYRISNDGYVGWIGDTWVEVSLSRREVMMNTNGGNSSVAIRRQTLTADRLEKLFEGLTGHTLDKTTILT